MRGGGIFCCCRDAHKYEHFNNNLPQLSRDRAHYTDAPLAQRRWAAGGPAKLRDRYHVGTRAGGRVGGMSLRAAGTRFATPGMCSSKSGR